MRLRRAIEQKFRSMGKGDVKLREKYIYANMKQKKKSKCNAL